MKKNIVVFMEKSGGVRLLTNPKNIAMYENKSNAVINPVNLKDLLKKGIGPGQMSVIGGELFHNNTKAVKNMAQLKGHHKKLISNEKGFKWSSIILWSGLFMLLLVVYVYMAQPFLEK